MSFTLDQLSNAFANNKPKYNDSPSNSPFFPFWNMDFNESTRIRFIADPNQDNPFGFIHEKVSHNFKIDGKFKKVPCLEQYDEVCPICVKSQAFYAAEGKTSKRGKALYRTKQYLSQAIVIESPLLINDQSPIGKIFAFSFGFQIYSVIKEIIESGDLDHIPFDNKNGTDFIIKKTDGGQHAKYDVGSRFVRNETSLTPEQVKLLDSAVELHTLLPVQPTLDHLETVLKVSGY